MNIYKYFKISTIIIFAFSLFAFSFPVSAQKVLQCAPGQATVNNNLRVNGDLTVNNNAAVNNNAIVTNDLSVINGNLYLGSNGAKPYITDNAGFGILFYSQGGDNFLWQSGNGNPGAAAMVLGAVSGLPVGDNGFNLQVHGKVSSYQLHTLGIHLDMQSGIGPTPKQNILRITNTDNTGSGFGAAVFHGANNWQANTDDNLIFSGLTIAQDIGTIGLTINTVSGNIGIQTINPQITLAIGDNDTGLKWISDGNFQLVSNGIQELTIDPGNVRIRNNLCFGVDCKSAWPAAAVESDPIWTSASANYYTTTNLQTLGQANMHWGNLTNIPPELSDGDQVGITSVPVCGAGQKLTGDLTGSPVCANDLDTDTDTQDLTIVGNVISLTDGGSITLPAGASGDITSVVAGTNLTDGGASGDVTLNVANSPNFSGDLIVQGNTVLGNARTDTTMVSGRLDILGGDITFGEDNKNADLYFRCTSNGTIDTEWNMTDRCAWKIGSYPAWNPLGTFPCASPGALTTPTVAQIYDVLVNQLAVKTTSYEFSKMIVDIVNAPQDAVGVNWCGGGAGDGTQGRILVQPWRELYFNFP